MAGTKQNKKKQSIELKTGERTMNRSDVLEHNKQMGSCVQEWAAAGVAAVVWDPGGAPRSLRITLVNQVKEHSFHGAATWREVGAFPFILSASAFAPRLNLWVKNQSLVQVWNPFSVTPWGSLGLQGKAGLSPRELEAKQLPTRWHSRLCTTTEWSYPSWLVPGCWAHLSPPRFCIRHLTQQPSGPSDPPNCILQFLKDLQLKALSRVPLWE